MISLGVMITVDEIYHSPKLKWIWNVYTVHHRALFALNSYPLKAGHGSINSWISNILPNIITLLDTLMNTCLGSRKSQRRDRAMPNTKKLIEVG